VFVFITINNVQLNLCLGIAHKDTHKFCMILVTNMATMKLSCYVCQILMP